MRRAPAWLSAAARASASAARPAPRPAARQPDVSLSSIATKALPAIIELMTSTMTRSASARLTQGIACVPAQWLD
jgi:hypothetical protein